jgi:O-antigen/teichoic acid export membrane protein
VTTAPALNADGTPAPDPSALGVPSDLGRQTARGAGVTLAGQGARILLQLVSVTVLARLLEPHDYGLVAVGLVMVGVGEVVRDLGLTTAAMRAPELTDSQRDGLFWLNAVAGAFFAGIAFCAAGPLAAAFSEPQLTPIARAMSLTFLLNGCAAQYRAGLNRQLRFGAVVGSDLLAQLCSIAAAITVAASGGGYWALVVQQLVQASVALVAVVAFARWLPGPPRRRSGLRPFLRFGSGITGVSVVYYLGNNVDSLSLGLFAGPAALGLYNRGFQLLMGPLNQLRSPATTVAVPVLARLQGDRPRTDEYLRRSQLALGFTLVPAMAVVAGAARPIVDLMLGSRWHAVAPVLALLAVAGSAQTLALVVNWVYLSRGLSGSLLRYTVVSVVLNVVCVGAGVRGGVVGVATGYTVAALLEWPLSLWWVSRVTAVAHRTLLRGAIRILTCGAFAGGACFVATELTSALPPVLRILAGAAAGAATYGIAALVPSIRADLSGVVSWGRQMVLSNR